MVLLSLDPEGNYREPKGWVNHPAVKMWRGHESALLLYIDAMVIEWKLRGFKSTIGDKARKTYQSAPLSSKPTFHTYPSWIQDVDEFEAVASTHRQALLVKDYSWYSQFGWPEDTGVQPTEYEYIWPTDKEKVNGY
jgi:hypothetical protein